MASASDETSPINGLKCLFYDMLTSRGPVETLNLTRSFGWDSRDVFTQQDVQEFSCILLDVIEKKAEREGRSNFVKDIFCGKMINYIRCTKVQYESIREETFYDIQLPIKGFKDVYASLRDYTQEEDLTGDNQYDTVKLGKQDAKKGIKFKILPKILFFHLRRFEYDLEQDENTKIVQNYQFPDNLEMNPFTVDPEMQPPETTAYSLMSIMVHVGNRSNSGHYISFVQPQMDGRWFKLNDETISECSKQYVNDMSFGEDYIRTYLDIETFSTKEKRNSMMSQAYMLVYIRTRDIKANLVPIPISIVDPFVRAKVEADNAEAKKREYWARNKLVYIVLPEMLEGKPITGCLVDHKGYFDKKKLSRFLSCTEQRIGLVVDKNLSLQAFLLKISEELGIGLESIFIWRFDPSKDWLYPLLSKKTMREAKTKRISSVFKANTAELPLLYIQVIPSPVTPLTQQCPPVPVFQPDMVCNDQLERMYQNTLRFTQSGKVGHDDDQLYDKILLEEEFLVLTKTFTNAGALVFSGSLILPSKTTIGDLQNMYPKESIFLEQLTEGNRLLVVSLGDDPDGLLINECPNNVGILIMLEEGVDIKALAEFFERLALTAFIRLYPDGDPDRTTTHQMGLRDTLQDLFNLVQSELLEGKHDLDCISLSSLGDNGDPVVWYPKPKDLEGVVLEQLLTHSDEIEYMVSRLPYTRYLSSFEFRYKLVDPLGNTLLEENDILDNNLTLEAFKAKYNHKLRTNLKESVHNFNLMADNQLKADEDQLCCLVLQESTLALQTYFLFSVDLKGEPLFRQFDTPTISVLSPILFLRQHLAGREVKIILKVKWGKLISIAPPMLCILTDSLTNEQLVGIMLYLVERKTLRHPKSDQLIPPGDLRRIGNHRLVFESDEGQIRKFDLAKMKEHWAQKLSRNDRLYCVTYEMVPDTDQSLKIKH